ncbi:MAG: hypothetical protein A3E31_11720 [Candidatus Rokubacteria bacterium RIFCSPHIGHO2_12_FULL_73_22]|nr:MAG: hypothetical protein A3D33_05060 [Candidatus Rokubacteria bacterium RIFCSPHIGHO2_02_FULL_73_26]OGL04698.1 MAG: hypothetical protein A3E31_11720 [Candidatus Rokubacteria bacterium RIFCSPHIGHO2_12_FULL_73_22]OGL08560.1 MAG: hypothetical protein A3I14_14140 [Candidatus Rokubacteria bacterium RIFCSPLOWO2_02_FULL_73_56]
MGDLTMAAVRQDAMPGSALWTRALTALVSVPAFVWVVTRAPGWVFEALVLGLAGAASWELGRIFARAGRSTHRWLGVVAGVAVTASFRTPGGPIPALALAVLVVLSVPIWTRRAPSAEAVTIVLLGLTYVSWLLGHALLLQRLADGPALILFLVGVTWIGESAAYLVGSALGRRRLAPVISPRKTVEGALAQLLASGATALALGAWLLPEWPLAASLGAGALLGVVGQVGDLAESVIKRSVGAKDTGGLVPGHGGVLDRLDSLLFSTPALFYFATWTGLAA